MANSNPKPLDRIHFFLHKKGVKKKRVMLLVPPEAEEALMTLGKRYPKQNIQQAIMMILDEYLSRSAQIGVISWPKGDDGE